MDPKTEKVSPLVSLVMKLCKRRKKLRFERFCTVRPPPSLPRLMLCFWKFHMKNCISALLLIMQEVDLFQMYDRDPPE